MIVVLVLAGASLGADPLGGGGQAGPTPAVCADPSSELQDGYRRWARLHEEAGAAGAERWSVGADRIVEDAFALSVVGRRILESRWDDLPEEERRRFREALGRNIRARLASFFEPYDPLPRLQPSPEGWREVGELVEADYWLTTPDERDWLTLRVGGAEGESCGIVDIRKGDRSLLDDLNSEVEDLLDDYSFPYMIAVVGDYDEVVLADFEGHETGELPRGWTWRDGDADKNKPYRVRAEDGNRYLEATDEGESVILGREQPWDIHEYPYVSFRVRVNEIPEGGDERDDDRVDSAAGIYFTVNKKFFGKIPESVKYVWSPTLPVGTAVRREGIGRPWQVVFGTGEEGLGEWRTYVFDLREAYRRTFGGDPPGKTAGIGILSDANSMGGHAYADYDDIRALRHAPPGVGSGVDEIVPPLDGGE